MIKLPKIIQNQQYHIKNEILSIKILFFIDTNLFSEYSHQWSYDRC